MKNMPSLVQAKSEPGQWVKQAGCTYTMVLPNAGGKREYPARGT